jgi:hypothetical protein
MINKRKIQLFKHAKVGNIRKLQNISIKKSTLAKFTQKVKPILHVQQGLKRIIASIFGLIQVCTLSS